MTLQDNAPGKDSTTGMVCMESARGLARSELCCGHCIRVKSRARASVDQTDDGSDKA